MLIMNSLELNKKYEPRAPTHSCKQLIDDDKSHDPKKLMSPRPQLADSQDLANRLVWDLSLEFYLRRWGNIKNEGSSKADKRCLSNSNQPATAITILIMFYYPCEILIYEVARKHAGQIYDGCTCRA